jgi:hypothetical protein
MKILIVSYSFAPLNVISAQRINAMAAHFSRQGHRVDVLTSLKAPIDGPLDGSEARERLGELANIHEVPFMGRAEGGAESSGQVLAPRLDNASRALAKKLKAMVGWLLGALFDYRTLWALAATRYYGKRLRSNGYDLVITSSGPPAVNLVGWAIARQDAKIRWHADFRDLWSLLHTARTSALTHWLERRLERRLLKRASRITTVSEDLAAQMGALHGSSRVAVVRNGFDPAEMQGISPDHAFFEEQGLAGKMNLVYAGSIYAGRRDPSPLLAAIVRSGLQQRFAVHFFGAYMENLRELIAKEGADSFCYFHGGLPRSRVLAIQKAARINLFLESGGEDARGVLTGKLFELAALLRPVLTVGPKEDFESVELLRRTGLLIHWESLGEPAELEKSCANLIPDEGFVQTLSRSMQFASWPLDDAPGSFESAHAGVLQ